MSTTFADLGVPPELVSVLEARGIHSPFAIQALTLADGCAGRDLCGRAPTGSGKTLAFGIPLAMRVGRAAPRKPTGLVLVPTRELAAQVRGELEWLGRYRDLRVAAVYGGTGYGAQLKALRRGVDVLVACPGRLTDLIERADVTLDAVEIVVVDEADRMADMGFLPVVERLLDRTPATRQTLLFSATLDGAVDTLVRRYQRQPLRHELPVSDEPLRVTHLFWGVETDQRVRLCADVVKLAGPTIVFCKTKRGTDRIARQLRQAGVHTEAIHGNRSQGQRDRALAAFAGGTVDALVATDVAARGIHVDSVACVVHFDLPNDAKDYLHRSGRTARAGAAGTVVSFVPRDRARDAAHLQRAIGMRPGLASPDRDALTSITPDAVSRRSPSVAAIASRAAVTAGTGTGDPSSETSTSRGAIKWFDPRKGFGFIERHDGDDLFVHCSAIEGGREQRVDEGQIVDFEIGPGRKGPQARRVRLLARAS